MMNNPLGNLQNFMNIFKQMMNNPQQYVMSQFGVPKEIADDPNKIIQQMMSSGRLSQSRYNTAWNMFQQIQGMFGQYMK